MTPYPTKQLAHFLAHTSLDIRQGDVVAISSRLSGQTLITAVFEEVLQLGGRPFVLLGQGMPDSTRVALEDQEPGRVLNPLNLEDGLEIAHIVDIRVQSPPNESSAVSDLVADRQLLGENGSRHWSFLVEAHRKGLNWVGVHYPDVEAYSRNDARSSAYFERVIAATLLDQPNPVESWAILGDQQQRVCDYLEGGEELRFVSPGTDLRLNVAGRRWVNLDGRRINFPGGEVLSSPIEDTANGVVEFSFPFYFYGRRIDGVRLEFRDGQVVEASASVNEEALHMLLDMDPGARKVGEIAFGTHYAITRPVENTLLDEKIGGTFHIALGMSYPQTGGSNQSIVHADMVCDMRGGGQCMADNKVISENGRFLFEDWPHP